MQIVYMAMTGPADPTRASIPFHLAVNGSAEIGDQAVLVFGGDAAELLKPGVIDTVEGVGLPPLRELIDKAKQLALDVYV